MTQDMRETVRYLSRVRRINERITRLLEEKRRWRDLALCRSPGISPAPGGGPTVKPEDKMLEVEEEINQEIDHLQEVRKEVKGAISGVEDDTLRTLLEYRYLDGLTWEQVAERIPCTERWVYKLHKKALKKINCSW